MTDERDEKTHRPVMIFVETAMPDGSTTRRVIDHSDRESRIWLGKHCYWALRNGVTVRTGPIGEGA